MTSLKPCPFCGGEATVERIGRSGYYYVACNTAFCCDFGKFDTEPEAIAAWNTRAELGNGTCRIEERNGDWYCDACGEMVGTCDPTSELYIDGNAVELWNYCPNCGKRVKGGGND